MEIKVNKWEPQCSEINYELLQETLEECDHKLQNKAQEDEFVEIQEDEIKMAKDEESKFTKMQSEFKVDFTYHHPSAIWLLNTRKTIEECAKSAYEMAEFLDDSQQVKVENANFKSGVENIISGGAKVLDGVYGISCNPYKVTCDLISGSDNSTLNDIKKNTSQVLLGVGQVASSVSSAVKDVAVNCISGPTPKSTLASVFCTAWQYLGVAV
ncbi:MAG: hypothetical protein LBU02_03030 [Rickettsiales bacterium]|jgi:hypothetical protein|nr:hypothetical protein [Rickettsiales bacterium]